MKMRMPSVVAAMTMVAGLAAATLSGSPALVLEVVLVALTAWGLAAFLEWRSALRLRVTGASAPRRGRRRAWEPRRD